MRIEFTESGCELIREPGDKRISKESTVVFHMSNLLQASGRGFQRMYPDRHGLTSCKLGLYERKSDTALWHDRYQIEAAHEAFNNGSVWFQRVDNAKRGVAA